MTYQQECPNTSYENLGAINTASARGQRVTANASGNTKGTYVQLGTSGSSGDTTRDYQGFLLQVAHNAQADYLLDIAIGASSAEKIIVENFPLSGSDSSITGGRDENTFLPVYIPLGSKVWCRCQSSTGSSTLDVMIIGLAADSRLPPAYRGAWNLSADTATSRGVTVDPGATGGTLGSYAQIAANTSWNGFSREIAAIMFSFGSTGGGNTKAAGTYLLDFAIGAAASEKIIVPQMQLKNLSGVQLTPLQTPVFPCRIPAGSRTAARARPSFSTGTQSARDFDMNVMAFVQ